MKKLLLILLVSTNVHASELMANFPTGVVVIKDSICILDELVDDYPYMGYVVSPKGVVTDGCWGRAKTSSMVVFIEKVKKDRYEYNKIEARYFK